MRRMSPNTHFSRRCSGVSCCFWLLVGVVCLAVAVSWRQRTLERFFTDAKEADQSEDPTTVLNLNATAAERLTSLEQALRSYKTRFATHYNGLLNPLTKGGGTASPPPPYDRGSSKQADDDNTPYIRSYTTQQKLQFWMDYYNSEVADVINQTTHRCIDLREGFCKKSAKTHQKISDGSNKAHGHSVQSAFATGEQYGVPTSVMGSSLAEHNKAVAIQAPECPCGNCEDACKKTK